MWGQAIRGENEFIPIFLPWFTEPLYKKGFPSDVELEQFKDEVNRYDIGVNGEKVHTTEYNLMKKFNLTYEQLNWRRYTIANKCNGDLDKFKQEYPSTPEEAFIASGRPKFNIKALNKYAEKTKEGTRGYLLEENGMLIFEPDEKGYIEIWEEPDPYKSYSIGADVAEGLIHGDYSCAYVGDEDFNIVAK